MIILLSKLFSLLNVSVLNVYWRLVLFMANNDVICRGKQRDSSKHSNVPIHRLRRDRSSGWEKAKNEERNQKHEGDDIDCHSIAP